MAEWVPGTVPGTEGSDACMLINRLKINYFGKFSDKEIELKPGINLIYGENEAGKSTIHTFIKGMLFGIERLRGRGAATKDDIYSRYLPWDYPGAYGGQMDIIFRDKGYRLQRSFHANDKAFAIIDLKTGREIKLKEDHISELIPGLTESTYRNTISIEQLRAETDNELASHVRNYITNLSIARSKEVNVEKALDSLKAKRKTLESLPFTEQLSSLADEIKDGEAREKKIDALIESLKELKLKEGRLKEEIEKHKSKRNKRLEESSLQLPAILEKYRSYRGLLRDYSLIDSQEKVLKEQLFQYKKHLDYLDRKEKERNKSNKSKIYIYIVLSLVLGMLGFVASKSVIVGALILFLALSIGMASVFITNKRKQETSKEELVRTGLSLEHGDRQLEEMIARKKKLEDEYDELHDTIMLYMQEFISEDQLTSDAIERLKESIDSRRSEAENTQDEQKKQLEEYRFQIEKIGWELSSLEENEAQLIRDKELYDHIILKQKESKLELDAVNLAIDSIEELSSTIHDSFGLELNLAVSDIIDSVSNQKYQELKIDEKLNIKLGWKDKYILLDRLSAGTIDQVYFALRLAVSELLLGNEPMPLILDDSFVLYDDNRLQAVLGSIAKRSQVILFSCQKREKQILEEMGIKFNYIEL